MWGEIDNVTDVILLETTTPDVSSLRITILTRDGTEERLTLHTPYDDAASRMKVECYKRALEDGSKSRVDWDIVEDEPCESTS